MCNTKAHSTVAGCLENLWVGLPECVLEYGESGKLSTRIQEISLSSPDKEMLCRYLLLTN
jgi:hypothetical protein